MVFNDVFLVVKRYCKNQKPVTVDSFKAIAREANVPLRRLPGYLDYLHKQGLIRYEANHYIYLTSLGESYENLVRYKGPLI